MQIYGPFVLVYFIAICNSICLGSSQDQIEKFYRYRKYCVKIYQVMEPFFYHFSSIRLQGEGDVVIIFLYDS
jgi:hypothetical protein